MDFTDKVMLVTGGSRGIGRAICIQAAEAGAKVAVHYRSNESAAQETLGMLAGAGHHAFAAEAADAASVDALIEAVVDKMGRIDVLINNAGIYIDHKIDEIDYAGWQAAWQQVIAVNLFGPANLMYCAAQKMIAQGGGRIVNISSRGAFRGEPEAPAYGASKAGMNAMSQSLAKQLGKHNVFVAVVAPGFVETDMAAGILATPKGEFLRSESPLNRVAKPEEVAHAALFLASEGTEFYTGCILDVNGASYLRT